MDDNSEKIISPIFFEKVLIKLLFKEKEIKEKIFVFLKPEIFDDIENRKIISLIIKFVTAFNNFPTLSEMLSYIKNDEKTVKQLNEIIEINLEDFSTAYILSEIEKFIQTKLLWNEIAEIAEKLKTKDDIKNIVSLENIKDAISFSFNTEIGLDFLNSEETMYDFLHNRDRVVSTGIRNLDRKIEGGLHEKSLTLWISETNQGKTLIKCSIATNILLQNKNVLYISLEMSEKRIAERIMANLFDINMDDLKLLSKDIIKEKYGNIKKIVGKNLVIKEYPPKSINSNTIKQLIKELQTKKKFSPDIIMLDYMGLMSPNQIRKEENSYTEMKRISEELRAVAVEYAIPIMSSMQTNRGGFSNAVLELVDIADSIGTAATADLIIGISQSEEFRKLCKFCFMILKNRYGLNKDKIYVNVNYNKMRIWDDEQQPQQEKKEPEKPMEGAAQLVTGILKNDREIIRKKVIEFH